MELIHYLCTLHLALARERTIIGSISYRNWYWVYRIESHRPSVACITAGSSTVDGSHYTRWSQGVQATCHPPAVHARVRAVLWFMIRERVGGERGGRRL